MPEHTNEIFQEIKQIHQQCHSVADRYHYLNTLLVRCVKQLTANYKVDFTNFSSRLSLLCKEKGLNPFHLEVFRSRNYKIKTTGYLPDKENYESDLKAICESIAVFYDVSVPQEIQVFLPEDYKIESISHETIDLTKRIRVTVAEWDEHYIYGKITNEPSEKLTKICYNSRNETVFASLHEQLYEGAQINLINVKKTKERNDETILLPEIIVLDPDFVIDITSLCGCIKPYGISPYTYILNKFNPAPKSASIQLGNIANQFLDDCVNESDKASSQNEEESYLQSIQKSFSTYPILYTTLEGIDRQFFERCRLQFNNIKSTVNEKFSSAEIDIKTTDVQLEPSFVCEPLGIQGRMDLLTTDCKKIVELKSGKAEEFPYRSPRKEHRLQMALYKEILYHNLDIPYEAVESYLFYSHYPQFYAINASRSEIKEIISLRNSIVHLEHRLRNGESHGVLGELNESRLNISQRSDKLYTDYLRPQIMQTLHPLSKMSDIESDYLHTFLTFIEREHFLAKIGDTRPESSNGFADTWNCDYRTKWENGNILTDLTITPLTDINKSVTHIRIDFQEFDCGFLPNFRQGDMVMLYERNKDTDDITNKQFFRCLIEEINGNNIMLKLSFPQRNSNVFRIKSLYAIEPGYMDSTFNQAYSGLFKLLTASTLRKELLLGQRAPLTDKTVKLNGNYANKEINDIVLKAKQAEDYFLLIGPPGTGKTSIALKSMVEEFLSDNKYPTILLMAFTNRAVDEICSMLTTIQPTVSYIRIGQELNCAPEFRANLIGNVISSATTRREIYERLMPIRIFVGTISSMCNHTDLFDLKPIDVAIIDEASQVLEPQLLPLLCAKTKAHCEDYNLRECAIRKFILIGDHKQLPSVVTQSVEQSQVKSPRLNAIGLTDCRNSLFERLHTLQEHLHTDDIIGMLHRQGRMHPELSDYVNTYFYESRLGIVPLTHQVEPLEFHTYPNDEWHEFVAKTRLGMIDIAETSDSVQNNKSNRKEAETVVRLIETIYQLYSANGISPDIAKRIGIIVPFRAQIAMIRNLLSEHHLEGTNDITIDTVERYQGSQRDIILFSSTIKQYYQLAMLSEPTKIEGRWIDRKLNVAITRARKQFFLVGNGNLLRKSQAYEHFISYIEEHDGMLRL